MSTCLINHSAEGNIPENLCRACHPELAATDEQWDEARAKAREALAAQGHDTQAQLREQQKKTRAEQHKAAAALRKTRTANKVAAKAATPFDTTGLRWDGHRGKWIPDSPITKEGEMSCFKITPFDAKGVPVARAITQVAETATQTEIDARVAYAVKRGGTKKVVRLEITKNGELIQAVIPNLDFGPSSAVPKIPKVSAPKKSAPAKNGKEGGSKTEIVAALLRRPEGCTTADVLKATGWPAVSMPAMAKAAGLTLRKEKNKGSPTQYFGS